MGQTKERKVMSVNINKKEAHFISSCLQFVSEHREMFSNWNVDKSVMAYHLYKKLQKRISK